MPSPVLEFLQTSGTIGSPTCTYTGQFNWLGPSARTGQRRMPDNGIGPWDQERIHNSGRRGNVVF